MAELVVSVTGAPGDPAMTCKYELRTSTAEGTGPLQQEYVAEPSPDLVRRTCDELDRIIKDAVGPAPGAADAEGELAKVGKLLYRALFTSAGGGIPSLVAQLSKAEGPLLVRTNESGIPWELLHDGDDFLALGRDIGRRTFVTRPVVSGRAPDAIRRALIIGDPLGDLFAARAEAEQVTSWLTGHSVDCTVLLGESATLLRVIDELSTGRYDLLHYAGHVAELTDTNFVGLLLHGKELLDGRALETLATFGAPPIVVVNGCASAGRLANLCVSFMVMGAKVVVGTRHPVREAPSRDFAERFYTELVSGATAGGAVRTARRSLRKAGSIEWATFVLYGDPATRIAMGEPQRAIPARPPSDLGRYRMDDEARALVDRMIHNAAPLGLASSLELLMELLPTDAMRTRISDTVDAGRLKFATELLNILRESLPAGDPGAGGRVELSDTVSTVLVRAERAAQRAGRATITIADLVDEFIALGGGSSGQLLGLMGMPLSGPGGATPSQTGSRETTTQTAPGTGLDSDVSDGDLFDGGGDIRADRFDPDVARAIRIAALLASLSGSTISTALLLCGFVVAGGDAVRTALERQGDAGAAVMESLVPKRRTRRNRFSPRTRQALLDALGEQETLDEATVLRHLLADSVSSAREVLRRSSVDPDRLVQDL
ncbi:CHAT domain-containing protein [Amycolatopsis sp. NPDC051071]|uniref:CHAT domain-containing protein n=1 Tax=Amycolatopsis sp. NPDC051071 TaxID=3154637 RepID=UPI003445C852